MQTYMFEPIGRGIYFIQILDASTQQFCKLSGVSSAQWSFAKLLKPSPSLIFGNKDMRAVRANQTP